MGAAKKETGRERYRYVCLSGSEVCEQGPQVGRGSGWLAQCHYKRPEEKRCPRLCETTNAATYPLKAHAQKNFAPQVRWKNYHVPWQRLSSNYCHLTALLG